MILSFTWKFVPTTAGVGNFVYIINYAVRKSNKVLENQLKSCSKLEIYILAITQNDLAKCSYEVTT